jgi:hypothetical protein
MFFLAKALYARYGMAHPQLDGTKKTNYWPRGKVYYLPTTIYWFLV